MAQHKVDIRVPSSTLSNVDICFDAYADGEKLGTLQLSKGSVEWLPGKATRHGHRLNWTKFAEVMETNGRAVSNIKRKK